MSVCKKTKKKREEQLLQHTHAYMPAHTRMRAHKHHWLILFQISIFFQAFSSIIFIVPFYFTVFVSSIEHLARNKNGQYIQDDTMGVTVL